MPNIDTTGSAISTYGAKLFGQSSTGVAGWVDSGILANTESISGNHGTKHLDSDGRIALIALLADPAITTHTDATTVGSVAWALTQFQAYSSGTVAWTQNQRTVTLTGGTWNSDNVWSGAHIQLGVKDDGGGWNDYVVESLTDGTHLTVTSAIKLATRSGAPYSVGVVPHIICGAGVWYFGDATFATDPHIDITINGTTIEGVGYETNFVYTGTLSNVGYLGDTGVIDLKANKITIKNHRWTIADAANTRGKGFLIHGAPNTFGHTITGIVAENITGLIAVGTNGGAIIDLSNAYRSTIADCIFQNCITPVGLTGSSTQYGNRVVNNLFLGGVANYYFIYCDYPWDTVIHGNVFEDTAGAAAIIIGDSYNAKGGVVITSNIFNSGNAVSIRLLNAGSGSQKHQIGPGNQFRKGYIEVNEGVSDCLFEGNTFLQTGTQALSMRGGTRNAIRNNCFVGNNGSAITLSTTTVSYLYIDNNKFRNYAKLLAVTNPATAHNHIAVTNNIFESVAAQYDTLPDNYLTSGNVGVELTFP